MFSPHLIPYSEIHNFSKIILDYLGASENLKTFYSFPPNEKGIQEMIGQKKKQKINRTLLTDELQQQYQLTNTSELVKTNIELLREENTFTICTAHQPNLFTGPLFFMYKILHTIKMAASLKKNLPQYNFVPLYYMGSEDADFTELNHTYVKDKKIEWKKQQSGAVGRMVVDDTLIQLIEELKNQLYAEPCIDELINSLRRCYTFGKTIQTATFELVNELYGEYGLIVFVPDNANLKRQMVSIFADDIFNQTSSLIVAKTSARLEQQYKVQANPREINLFYLKENIRERIVKKGEEFLIHNTELRFTRQELEEELKEHPEYFSPNVILRGLYQETILPNIAFIGGGGELAYWLQLKDLFTHFNVPFPILILRNSFLIIEKQYLEIIKKLGLNTKDIFLPETQLLNSVIERSGKKPELNGQLTKVEQVYAQLDELVADIDSSLSQHVAALKTKTLNQLQNLEKKMMRAERKKHNVVQNKIAKLKQVLFPQNNLQERVENFSSYHAKWGRTFIDQVLKNSLSMEMEFVVLNEDLPV